MKTPLFAVVGQPNKGKSSLVATLSRNQNIEISPASGTTTNTAVYDVNVAGSCIYQLADTPGFQRANSLLSWLESKSTHAGNRNDAVKLFLKDAQLAAKFPDEHELLTPIAKGAGILYVIDASVPYHQGFEAEMSILQWTGAPRMALINCIADRDYTDQWKKALGQYFNIVRSFNPMVVAFDQQVKLLDGFAQIDESWGDMLIKTAQLLKKERQEQIRQASHNISEGMLTLIQCEQHMPLLTKHSESLVRLQIQKSFEQQLKDIEQKLFHQIFQLFQFNNLVVQNSEIPSINDDMFNVKQWQDWGISKKRIILLSASAGLMGGAAIDMAVGGSSFLLGSIAGSIAGGSAGFAINKNVALTSLNANKLSIGPINNIQFIYSLLGRLINFTYAVSSRTHARRDELVVEYVENWISALSQKQQVELTAILLKASKNKLSDKDLGKLSTLVERILNNKPSLQKNDY